MSERFTAIKQGWDNFQVGGGVKTIARRFVQTAPYAAIGLGAGGFFAGDILPGLGDLLSNTSANPSIPQAPLPSAPEYGVDWAVKGASIGVTTAAIEAIVHPFAVGAAINRGELDEIPPMPNIGHVVIHGLRRGFDHVVNLPRDFKEGGGWQEFNSNLAIFGAGGSVLGFLGGMGVDAVVIANAGTEFAPVESSLAGVATGVALGGITAFEVTAGEGRRARREEEGLTTVRSLFRRRRREVPKDTVALPLKPSSVERAQQLGDDLDKLLQRENGEEPPQDTPT